MPCIIYTGVDRKHDGRPGVLLHVDHENDECEVKVEGSDARVRVASKCVFAMAYGLLEARAKEANDDVRARELKDKVREAAALEHRRQAEERLEMLQHMTEVETEKQKARVEELAHMERRAFLEARAEADLAEITASHARIEMQRQIDQEEGMLIAAQAAADQAHHRHRHPQHPVHAADHAFLLQEHALVAEIAATHVRSDCIAYSAVARFEMGEALARAKATMAAGRGVDLIAAASPVAFTRVAFPEQPATSNLSRAPLAARVLASTTAANKSSTGGRAAAAATGVPAGYNLSDVIGRAKVLAARIRIKQDSAQRTFSRMAKLERFDSTAKHYYSTSVPAK